MSSSISEGVTGSRDDIDGHGGKCHLAEMAALSMKRYARAFFEAVCILLTGIKLSPAVVGG